MSDAEGFQGKLTASGTGYGSAVPFTILITGGIGSGKSAVCDYLRGRGVPVYDSDSRTKSLYDRHPEIIDALEKSLGMTLRGADGALDRRRLASVIFNSEKALRRCEAIVHPAVLSDFVSWRKEISGGAWCGYLGQTSFVCMESAIAMEKPLFRSCYDVSVCVTASEETCIARVCERDGCGRADVAERIRTQGGVKPQADYVIENDGTRMALEENVDTVFSTIVSKICLPGEEIKGN